MRKKCKECTSMPFSPLILYLFCSNSECGPESSLLLAPPFPPPGGGGRNNMQEVERGGRPRAKEKKKRKEESGDDVWAGNFFAAYFKRRFLSFFLPECRDFYGCSSAIRFLAVPCTREEQKIQLLLSLMQALLGISKTNSGIHRISSFSFEVL